MNLYTIYADLGDTYQNCILGKEPRNVQLKSENQTPFSEALFGRLIL